MSLPKIKVNTSIPCSELRTSYYFTLWSAVKAEPECSIPM
jgi:hypothetical protein